MRLEDDLDSLLSADTSFFDKTVFFYTCPIQILIFAFSFNFFVVLARLHEVHRAIVVTSVVPFTFTSASHFRLKLFRSLYLLTMLMDQVDTLHVDRYWSEVLRSVIMTHPG